MWSFLFGFVIGCILTFYLYTKYAEYRMYDWAKKWNEIKAEIRSNKGKRK